jgi:hypothetical protein
MVHLACWISRSGAGCEEIHPERLLEPVDATGRTNRKPMINYIAIFGYLQPLRIKILYHYSFLSTTVNHLRLLGKNHLIYNT